MITTLDRSQAPDFRVIESFDLVKAETFKLDNERLVYFINAGVQDVSRIELIFKAGSWYQDKSLVANAVGKLVQEGTVNYTADQLASKLDFYGAFLEPKVTKDYASITLYCLNKHLSHTLPLLKEIVTEAIYPENEIDTFKQREEQGLLTSMKKVSFLASLKFVGILFGENHPYGYNINVDDIRSLDRDSLMKFYQERYKPLNCDIIISGKIGEAQLNLVNQYFGQEAIQPSDDDERLFQPISSSNKQHFVAKEDAIQSAIKIGFPAIGKDHEDYHKLSLVNTILGGYFGSRLMTNIREDKGYTYGIGSGLVNMLKGSYFVISTEVGAEVCDDAVKEIYRELDRLKDELVGSDELNTVKNYMIGRFQRNTDGPFAWSDAFVALHKFGLGYEHYINFFEAVKEMTAEDVREIANKYFERENFFELVVGKR